MCQKKLEVEETTFVLEFPNKNSQFLTCSPMESRVMRAATAQSFMTDQLNLSEDQRAGELCFTCGHAPRV